MAATQKILQDSTTGAEKHINLMNNEYRLYKARLKMELFYSAIKGKYPHTFFEMI